MPKNVQGLKNYKHLWHVWVVIGVAFQTPNPSLLWGCQFLSVYAWCNFKWGILRNRLPMSTWCPWIHPCFTLSKVHVIFVYTWFFVGTLFWYICTCACQPKHSWYNTCWGVTYRSRSVLHVYVQVQVFVRVFVCMSGCKCYACIHIYALYLCMRMRAYVYVFCLCVCVHAWKVYILKHTYVYIYINTFIYGCMHVCILHAHTLWFLRKECGCPLHALVCFCFWRFGLYMHMLVCMKHAASYIYAFKQCPFWYTRTHICAHKTS